MIKRYHLQVNQFFFFIFVFNAFWNSHSGFEAVSGIWTMNRTSIPGLDQDQTTNCWDQTTPQNVVQYPTTIYCLVQLPYPSTLVEWLFCKYIYVVNMTQYWLSTRQAFSIIFEKNFYLILNFVHVFHAVSVIMTILLVAKVISNLIFLAFISISLIKII